MQADCSAMVMRGEMQGNGMRGRVEMPRAGGRDALGADFQDFSLPEDARSDGGGRSSSDRSVGGLVDQTSVRCPSVAVIDRASIGTDSELHRDR